MTSQRVDFLRGRRLGRVFRVDVEFQISGDSRESKLFLDDLINTQRARVNEIIADYGIPGKFLFFVPGRSFRRLTRLAVELIIVGSLVLRLHRRWITDYILWSIRVRRGRSNFMYSRAKERFRDRPAIGEIN